MICFYNKTLYKLSQTKPRIEAALCESLVALMRGFVLLIKQTFTMKKLSLVLGVLLLPSLAFASFDVSLKYGAKGDAVRELQEFLVEQGTLIGSPTGNFFALTLKGVKDFQTKNGLPATGFFGPQSRAKANDLLDITASDSAEQQETGTIASLSTIIGCTSTTGFSTVNGQSCNGTILWDVCKNIAGVQNIAPEGLYAQNGNCVPIPASFVQNVPLPTSNTQNNQSQIADLQLQYQQVLAQAMSNANYYFYKDSTEDQLMNFLNAPDLAGTAQANQNLVNNILQMRRIQAQIQLLGGTISEIVPVQQIVQPISPVQPIYKVHIIKSFRYVDGIIPKAPNTKIGSFELSWPSDAGETARVTSFGVTINSESDYLHNVYLSDQPMNVNSYLKVGLKANFSGEIDLQPGDFKTFDVYADTNDDSLTGDISVVLNSITAMSSGNINIDSDSLNVGGQILTIE